MWIAFCKGKARHVEEMPRIYLEGQALSWVLRVKFLGLHINYYLNEDIEIRLKQSDFIGRVNNLMYSFGYKHVGCFIPNAAIIMDVRFRIWNRVKRYTDSQYPWINQWGKCGACLQIVTDPTWWLDSTKANMHLVKYMLNQLQWYKGWPLV